MIMPRNLSTSTIALRQLLPSSAACLLTATQSRFVFLRYDLVTG